MERRARGDFGFKFAVDIWNKKRPGSCEEPGSRIMVLPTKARVLQETGLVLRRVVSNNQLRLVGAITADKLHVVCHKVVISSRVEEQPELGQTGIIDIATSGRIQRGTVPAADRRHAKYPNLARRIGCIEIRQLQGSVGAEITLFDARIQGTQDTEGIGANR